MRFKGFCKAAFAAAVIYVMQPMGTYSEAVEPPKPEAGDTPSDSLNLEYDIKKFPYVSADGLKLLPIDYDLLGENGEMTVGFMLHFLKPLEDLENMSEEELYSTDQDKINELKEILVEKGFKPDYYRLRQGLLRLRAERDGMPIPEIRP